MRQHQTGETPKPEVVASPAMEEVNNAALFWKVEGKQKEVKKEAKK